MGSPRFVSPDRPLARQRRRYATPCGSLVNRLSGRRALALPVATIGGSSLSPDLCGPYLNLQTEPSTGDGSHSGPSECCKSSRSVSWFNQSPSVSIGSRPVASIRGARRFQEMRITTPQPFVRLNRGTEGAVRLRWRAVSCVRHA